MNNTIVIDSQNKIKNINAQVNICIMVDGYCIGSVSAPKFSEVSITDNCGTYTLKLMGK
jgi:hypothetical protein